MIAIYPGTFDPATYGHIDIIMRASKVVDKLIVAVLNNSAKQPMFTVDERLQMLNETCGDISNIEITAFSGLLIEFAKHSGANAIIRGLRAVSDFEYEFQMALTNKILNEEVETLFISTSARYAYLSSSIVKEVAALGGCVESMVPAVIGDRLLQKIGK
ncbi:MAG: pantetheine-phosphate adenylyltransferase [Defluviitaleaceae bacterium]|nr:pantetheine-phosphate adenylyltransferase [Defluviitaleaceae bacterium]